VKKSRCSDKWLALEDEDGRGAVWNLSAKRDAIDASSAEEMVFTLEEETASIPDASRNGGCLPPYGVPR